MFVTSELPQSLISPFWALQTFFFFIYISAHSKTFPQGIMIMNMLGFHPYTFWTAFILFMVSGFYFFIFPEEMTDGLWTDCQKLRDT